MSQQPIKSMSLKELMTALIYKKILFYSLALKSSDKAVRLGCCEVFSSADTWGLCQSDEHQAAEKTLIKLLKTICRSVAVNKLSARTQFLSCIACKWAFIVLNGRAIVAVSVFCYISHVNLVTRLNCLQRKTSTNMCHVGLSYSGWYKEITVQTHNNSLLISQVVTHWC